MFYFDWSCCCICVVVVVVRREFFFIFPRFAPSHHSTTTTQQHHDAYGISVLVVLVVCYLYLLFLKLMDEEYPPPSLPFPLSSSVGWLLFFTYIYYTFKYIQECLSNRVCAEQKQTTPIILRLWFGRESTKIIKASPTQKTFEASRPPPSTYQDDTLKTESVT